MLQYISHDIKSITDEILKEHRLSEEEMHEVITLAYYQTLARYKEYYRRQCYPIEILINGYDIHSVLEEWGEVDHYLKATYNDILDSWGNKLKIVLDRYISMMMHSGLCFNVKECYCLEGAIYITVDVDPLSPAYGKELVFVKKTYIMDIDNTMRKVMSWVGKTCELERDVTLTVAIAYQLNKHGKIAYRPDMVPGWVKWDLLEIIEDVIKPLMKTYATIINNTFVYPKLVDVDIDNRFVKLTVEGYV